MATTYHLYRYPYTGHCHTCNRHVRVWLDRHTHFGHTTTPGKPQA